MLSGTEGDILNTVARLGQASKQEIRRELGLSLEYIDFVCQYLVRKGHLTFAKGRYSLAEEEIKRALSQETPEIDKELLKKEPVEQIMIKTEFLVEDESLALESNINKIGAKVEKEKFDINKLVRLLKKFRKGGKHE